MYEVYCDSFLLYSHTIENLKLIRPKVQLEDNKTGSFTFTIYPDHPYFSMINKLTSIITVYQDDFLLFRGRVLNEEIGFHNEKQITCEGDLAFLLDSVQRPYNYSGSITGFLTQLINNHNSQVNAAKQFILGRVTVTDPNNTISRSDINYTRTWDVFEKKLLEELGGHIIVRHQNGVHYLDYLADYTTISNQKIEFSKNLLDMKRTRKGESIITALIPLGANLTDADGNETDERLTIKSVNGGLDYIYDQDAVNRYGWIFGTNIWDDVTVASNLLTKGRAYLGGLSKIITKIELSAADLAGIEQNISSFHLGTYVRVTSNPHGIDQNFLVSKLSIDLMNPASNKLTLGGVVNSLTDGISKYTSITVKDGKDGKNGKGIGSITEYYAISSSNTTAPTSWATTIPTMTSTNKYLWNYEVITYTDNSTTETAKKVIGAYGDKGENGTSSYTHIRYSANSDGSNFVPTPTSATVYIGVYNGTSSTAPANKTSYTWSKYKGDKGDDGASGNGINSITYYYATSATQTAPSASSITSTTIPTLSATNKYLWQKEVIDFTDATVADKTTVVLIAVYGDKGTNGNSVTISSTSVTYQASSSGTTTPTGTWQNTVPSVSNGQYLWTKTVVTYSTGTSTTSYSVAYKGTDGSNGNDGIGISSVVNFYLATNASSGVTSSTPGWTTTVQSVSASKKYLWNYETITYSNNTSTSTTPCIIGAYGADGADGSTFWTTTTAPASPNYTFTISNLSGAAGQTPKVGDIIIYSYYRYTITSVASTTVLAGSRVSIRGATGAAGKDAAIQSDTPPEDTTMLWLDTSLNPPLMKRYAPEYQLLVAEPSDWASNYTAYFTFNSSTGTYSAVTGSTAPEFAEETYFQYVSWVVVNDTTQAFYLMEKNVSAELSKTESNIMSRVSEEYYLKDETDSLVSAVSTTVTQNKEAVDILFETYKADIDNLASGTDAQFKEITKYIRFDDGKILLGEVGNELELQIANDRISFLQSNAEVAYFSNNKLYVTDGEYTNSLRVGEFAFLPRENGNLSFKKI